MKHQLNRICCKYVLQCSYTSYLSLKLTCLFLLHPPELVYVFWSHSYSTFTTSLLFLFIIFKKIASMKMCCSWQNVDLDHLFRSRNESLLLFYELLYTDLKYLYILPNNFMYIRLHVIFVLCCKNRPINAEAIFLTFWRQVIVC